MPATAPFSAPDHADAIASTTDSSAQHGLLAQTLQELLVVGERLRRGPQAIPPNVEQFRANVHQKISSAGAEAKRLGYRDDSIAYAMYAVVAFLDESVLALSAPSLASWQGRPLQEELFQVSLGGDSFFSYLEALLAQPNSPELGDVLEVFQLCLLLGFNGRYGRGRHEELQLWGARLRDRLERIRGGSRPFSPRWEPPRVEHIERRRDVWQRRLLLAVVATASLAAVLLLVFSFVLRARVNGIAGGR